jgi:tRNA-specific 2-thiouridylase
MSGGVDSSTAAALLAQEGHDVIGIGLKLPEPLVGGESDRSCCGIANMDDARRVSDEIGIPFYLLNYEEIFEKSVIDYFCESYLDGRTPNPCVECNRVVKFGHLLKAADNLEADCIATGHYARICQDPKTDRYLLKKGVDPEKDQSYFLYPLSQEQLSRILFPLGEMTKSETRQLAKSLGIKTSGKPASQDICFLGTGDYRELLAERFPSSLNPGPIVNSKGEVLGRHNGVAYYTVGQRRGLGFGVGVPLYVLRVDPAANEVVVGLREELKKHHIAVRSVNWISSDEPDDPLELSVKIRYRQMEIPSLVMPKQGRRAEISFHTPPVGVAPGQSAVFYKEDLVVGGGIIE